MNNEIHRVFLISQIENRRRGPTIKLQNTVNTLGTKKFDNWEPPAKMQAQVDMLYFLANPKEGQKLALDGVVQWVKCQPANQKVAGLIPSQGICLSCRPGPQFWGIWGHVRSNHTLMFLSLSFSFPFPPCKNKQIKKNKKDNNQFNNKKTTRTARKLNCIEVQHLRN